MAAAKCERRNKSSRVESTPPAAAAADKWRFEPAAARAEQIRKVREQTAARGAGRERGAARGWLAFQRRGERIAPEEPAPPGVVFEWKIK